VTGRVRAQKRYFYCCKYLNTSVSRALAYTSVTSFLFKKRKKMNGSWEDVLTRMEGRRQQIGMRILDGEAFWVTEVVDGCSWGRGGGNSRSRPAASFFRWTTRVLQNSTIFYVIHYILNSWGFVSSCFRPLGTVSAVLDDLVRHVWCSSVDNSTTSSTP
jgi:hypothetical protein